MLLLLGSVDAKVLCIMVTVVLQSANGGCVLGAWWSRPLQVVVYFGIGLFRAVGMTT